MIGSIVGAGLGAAASIYGGWKASEAMKRVREGVEGQKRENRAWFDRRYNESATERADALRVLAKTEEGIRKRNGEAAGSAAVVGGTEEGVAATKGANAQAMAEAAAGIAAQGAAVRDGVEREFRQRDAALEGQLQGIEVQRANEIGKAVGGLGKVGVGLMNGFGEVSKGSSGSGSSTGGVGASRSASMGEGDEDYGSDD